MTYYKSVLQRLNFNMVHCGMITLCMFWSTQLFLSPLVAFGSTPTFDYDPNSPLGPENWGSLRPEWYRCQSGQQQSPIAINRWEPYYANESLGSLNFSYVPSQGTLFNRGHGIEIHGTVFIYLASLEVYFVGMCELLVTTVTVALAAGAGSLIDGNNKYELRQFHFHSPSEHVVDDVRFPLEMHLVHTTSDNKIAVIGVLFRTIGFSDGNFLDQFWDKLPNVAQVGANVSVGKVAFDNRLLTIGPSYARYMGSLTTPPCTESVAWFLELSEWNTVGVTQLSALAKIISKPNARPLQAINGREIEFYKYPRMPPKLIHTKGLDANFDDGNGDLSVE